MVGILPFAAFSILRAVSHATVPGYFAVPAAWCEGEVQGAFVQVLDVATIRVELACRRLVPQRCGSVNHSPPVTRAVPTRATFTVSLPAAGAVPKTESTSPSGSRAPPWPASINSASIMALIGEDSSRLEPWLERGRDRSKPISELGGATSVR